MKDVTIGYTGAEPSGKLPEFLTAEGFELSLVKVDKADALSQCRIFVGNDAALSLVAKEKGIAAFTGKETWNDLDLHDLKDGYLIQPGEWYAKLFPEPVIVANAAKLHMRLGATVNPRAIILNNGIEGRGGDVSLGRASHIGADGLLNLGPTDFKVGKFTLISANFSAHAMRHTTGHISNFAIKKGPFGFFGSVYEEAEDIEVGNDVWIGERVTCLPGVKIADGSVIGAGAVVTKSTEPYGIYAGNPAKLLRFRFEDEKIVALTNARWWDLPYQNLKDMQDHFQKDITEMKADELKEIFA